MLGVVLYSRHRRKVYLHKVYLDNKRAEDEEFYNNVDTSGPDGDKTERLDFLKSNPYKGLYEKPITSNSLQEMKSDLFEDATLFKPIPYSYILPEDEQAKPNPTSPSSPQEVTVSYPFEYPGKLDFLVSNPASSANLVLKMKPPRNDKIQSAVIVVHPNTNTAGMQYLLSTVLRENRIKILSTGAYLTSTLRKQQIFEKQFATFKSFAVEIPSSALTFSESEEFIIQNRLGHTFPADVEERSKILFNFSEFVEYLNISEDKASEICTSGQVAARIRHGLYISRVGSAEVRAEDSELKSKLKSPLFVINGFFPAMRTMYSPPEETEKGESVSISVQYMVVEWEGSTLSWSQFLDDVIGDEDPKSATAKSLRGRAFHEWTSLGLPTRPNSVFNNCVRVSSSAFEGLADKALWQPNLQEDLEIFRKKVGAQGVAGHVLQKWLGNAIVDGKGLFDHMYALDNEQCVKMASLLAGQGFSPH